MQTNRAPFCDVIWFVSSSKTEDGSGHYTEELMGEEILCSVCDGVSRAEFYESAKAGVKLSMTVEIWQEDYNGEPQICYEGKLYNIVRTYPTGRGTLELSCAEVVR